MSFDKTFDCIKQSLGAVEVDGSYSMPPQLLRTGCFQGPRLTSLNIIKPNKFISTANASVIDPDTNRLDLSLSLGFLSC